MHALQPKHTKTSFEEAEEVLRRFNITLTQLPKISQKDAAIEDGCEKGDVIKIERADEIFYRVVI